MLDQAFGAMLIDMGGLTRKRILVLGFFASLLLGTGVVMTLHQTAVPPIPQQFTQNPPTGLYHPRSLPGGLAFRPEATYMEKDGLITKFTAAGNKGSLLLTQQPKPHDVDLEQIDTSEKYLSRPGSVYILKGERDKIQAIVAAGNTWLLVSADESIPLQQVREFIDSLQPLPQKG
jgi:hypothetical protein